LSWLASLGGIATAEIRRWDHGEHQYHHRQIPAEIRNANAVMAFLSISEELASFIELTSFICMQRPDVRNANHHQTPFAGTGTPRVFSTLAMSLCLCAG
jgi:hypothetical protein